MMTVFQERILAWAMVAAGVGALLGSPGMAGTAVAQNTGPWGVGDNPAAKQADATYENYVFRSSASTTRSWDHRIAGKTAKSTMQS
jgi:hypothetical protein